MTDLVGINGDVIDTFFKSGRRRGIHLDIAERRAIGQSFGALAAILFFSVLTLGACATQLSQPNAGQFPQRSVSFQEFVDGVKMEICRASKGSSMGQMFMLGPIEIQVATTISRSNTGALTMTVLAANASAEVNSSANRTQTVKFTLMPFNLDNAGPVTATVLSGPGIPGVTGPAHSASESELTLTEADVVSFGGAPFLWGKDAEGIEQWIPLTRISHLRRKGGTPGPCSVGAASSTHFP